MYVTGERTLIEDGVVNSDALSWHRPAQPATGKSVFCIGLVHEGTRFEFDLPIAEAA